MKLFKKAHYEKVMEVESKEKTVQEYQKDIQRAERRISDIQAKCKHEKVETGWYSWRPGALQPSRICQRCYLRLGDASSEETAKAWADLWKDS